VGYSLAVADHRGGFSTGDEMYGTAAGFRTYFDDREIEYSAGWTDEFIEAKLLVASEWIDGRYRAAFPGQKTGLREQVREWPRTGAFDVYGYVIQTDEIPREIEQATYEAALREAETAGSLSVDFTPSKYKSVSIDGALSVTYAGQSYGSEVQPQFARIDEVIAPVLTGNAALSSLSGYAARV